MRVGTDELNPSIDTEGLKVSSAVFGEMVVAYLQRNAAIEMPHLAKGRRCLSLSSLGLRSRRFDHYQLQGPDRGTSSSGRCFLLPPGALLSL